MTAKKGPKMKLWTQGEVEELERLRDKLGLDWGDVAFKLGRGRDRCRKKYRETKQKRKMLLLDR